MTAIDTNVRVEERGSNIYLHVTIKWLASGATESHEKVTENVTGDSIVFAAATRHRDHLAHHEFALKLGLALDSKVLFGRITYDGNGCHGPIISDSTAAKKDGRSVCILPYSGYSRAVRRSGEEALWKTPD